MWKPIARGETLMAGGQLRHVLYHIRSLAGAAPAGDISDRALLARFAADRDQAAFAELVRRHGPLVWGVCRRLLRHEQDAEDAFQATFLVLARKAGAHGWKPSIAGWLYETARRTAQKARVAAARGRAREQEAQIMRPIQVDGEPNADELREALSLEVGRLPSRYREPLLLCAVEGLSTEEAARRLGCPAGTIKSRLARGRERLRALLLRRDVTLSAAGLMGLLAQEATAAPPRLLAESTITAALAAAAGQLGRSAAAVLAQEVSKTMLIFPIKIAVGILLTIGVICGYRLSVSAPQPEPDAQPAPAQWTAHDKAPRTDQDGDPMPAEAISRLGTTRFRHGELVNYMAFSPDAKLLISQSDIIRFWETASGRELRHFTPLPGHKLGAGSFSPDGKVLAVGGLVNESDPIVLCEVATGRTLKEFGKGQYELVTFSPDGKTLAAIASRRGRFELWDVETGQRLHAWDAHGQGYAVAFVGDGKTLMTSGRDKRVCFWDVVTGRQTGEIKDFPTVWRPFGPATQVSLSPDDRRLAVIRPKEDNPMMPTNQIGIWDVATGKEVCQLSAPKEEIVSANWSGFWAVAWAANGELVTAGPDDSVRIWDPVAARQVRRLRNASPFSLAVSRDGKHLAAGGESIRVIDLAKNPLSDVFPDLRAPGPPGDVAVAGGLAVTAQGDAVLWDAASGKELRRLGHPSGIATVHLSEDGRILFAACGDNTVRAWDTGTGWEKPDFELKKGTLGTPWAGPWGDAATSLALTSDGKLLFAVARPDGQINVHNAVTGKKVQSFRGHHSFIYALSFTPEARTLVVCFGDRTVKVWDVATGRNLRQFFLPDDEEPFWGGAVFTAALSPDGKLLAFGSQTRFLVLKDMVTGQDIRRLDKLADGVGPLAFSPDGKTLAWAGWQDPTVHLVEVLTGRERRTLHGHRGRVLLLAFCGDGKRLISGSSDATALVWDLTGKVAAGDQWKRAMSPMEIETAWTDLAGDDAARAYQTMRRLDASPADAVPYLRQRLQAIPQSEEKRLTRLIADLDSDQFAVRDQAAKEMEKLGEGASAACRNALESDPPPEQRRRLEKLLQKQADQMWSPSPEQLRTLRALEVLEQAGTPDARQVLQELAAGAPEARQTREAKAALERLRSRPRARE